VRGRAGVAGLVAALGLAASAGAQTEDVHAAVRDGFARLLGGPAELRADFVPDLHPGSYARLSLHARRARVETLEVDKVWIQVVGVVFDADALPRGELRATEVRDAALHAHIPIRAIAEYLEREAGARQVRLEPDRGLLRAEGVVDVGGAPVQVRLLAALEADGAPKVFLRLRRAAVNGLPLGPALLQDLERRVNPLVDLRGWPVAFPIRATQVTDRHVVVSSQEDLSKPCVFCLPAP
jgi:hypothetical protein